MKQARPGGDCCCCWLPAPALPIITHPLSPCCECWISVPVPPSCPPDTATPQAYEELQTTDKARNMREQELLRAQMQVGIGPDWHPGR